MAPDYTQDTITHEIDGLMYTSTKLPAMQAVGLLARCVQVLGDRGMRAAVMRHAREFADLAPQLVLDLGDVNLYGALLQVSYGLQQDPALPRDLMAQIKCSFLRPANVGGGSVQPAFDSHFAGELPHMMRVCEFAAVHNFLGFTLGRPSTSGVRTSGETQKVESSDSPSQSTASSTPPSPAGSHD